MVYSARIEGQAHPWKTSEAKGFTWQDYRDLLIAAHRQLSAPVVWVWDTLNIHLAPELASLPQRTPPGCGCTGCLRTRRT
jgi:hypothetical protein